MRLMLCLLFFSSHYLMCAQFTVTGLKGMINVPVAEVIEEGTFLFGSQTNAEAYKLITYDDRQAGSEYISVASIGFLKRFNITLTLSRIFGNPKQKVGLVSSIGDRSVQLTFQVLEEKKFIPSLVVNLADPLFTTTQYITTNHLVATKHLWNTNVHDISATLGYGLPIIMVYSNQETRRLRRKDSDFLKGFFGGVQYAYDCQGWTKFVASAEYDGWNFNSALAVIFWNRLHVKGFLQRFQYPGVGLHYLGKIR